MTELTATDLPLGTLFPDNPYNRGLLEGIAALKDGQDLAQGRLQELEALRRKLWAETEVAKSRGMGGFARFAANQYGFGVDEDDRLKYPWMTGDYRRIDYSSDYFICDREARTLAPTTIDHDRPRVIVFATGRAFAEKNARLGAISPETATEKARNVMSAQVYLVESRLVSRREDEPVQVAAVAYDMVTSEAETPALRIQAILDPSFLHPVSIRAAERIFGPLLGEFERFPTGRLVRRDGRLIGKAASDEAIIERLSGLVLVGGSVGCIVTLQAARWLDVMMQEAGISEAVREEAARSFLVVNLGPTTPLSAGPRTNLISVVNSRDEFVFAGNSIAPIRERCQARGRSLSSDLADLPEQESHSFSLLLEVAGSLTPKDDGLAFDPLGTHFGHSLKHYANGLRDLNFKSLVDGALARRGAFKVGELVAEF